MTPEAVATIVLAIVAVLGLGAAALGWFFRRGADERELAVAIRDNTNATSTLSQDLRDFRDYTVSTLHQYDIRLTRLEAPSNGSGAPYRDASTPGAR